MSMAQGKFNWLKVNYDKVIVIVMMAALIASALYLVLRIGQVRGHLTTSDDDLGQFELREVVRVDESLWTEKIEGIEKPFQSGVYSNHLMVSELRVFCTNALCAKPIPYHASVCPFCQTEQPTLDPTKRDDDMDGMPNSFELAHGLNPNDPDDALADLDGDGFTNIEEYNWGSKVNDPNDYPSVVAKLRVFRVISRPFMMRFKGVSTSSDGS
ncbi:MAG: hypothetical protein EOM20_12260, partial [Spartobacteria bacterium]|nr:hypothetical protein [Spartobacteria bacterium]